jgi:hypothetical protein
MAPTPHVARSSSGPRWADRAAGCLVGLLVALAALGAVCKGGAVAGGGGGGLRAAAVPQPQLALESLRAQKAALRKQLGALSCEARGVGPTGGYCLNETQLEIGGNNGISFPLADRLLSEFGGATVLDLGAGAGQYALYWAQKRRERAEEEQRGDDEAPPLPAAWTPYDGAENVEAVTRGRVRWADLTEPGLQLAVAAEAVDAPAGDGGKGGSAPASPASNSDGAGGADWVVSFEVAEHIPPGAPEVAFLDNLARHARAGLLMSWAVPGQAGHHHVNCRPREYVLDALAARGFALDEHLTAELRGLTRYPASATWDAPGCQGRVGGVAVFTCPRWFADTLYAFKRAPGSAQ